MQYVLINRQSQTKASSDSRLTFVSDAQDGKLMYSVSEGVSFTQLAVMYGAHVESLTEDSSRAQCPPGNRLLLS